MAVLRSVAIVTGLGRGFGTLAVAWEGPDTITAPMPAPGEPAAPDGCCR